jgi:hypothetical protein
MFNKDNIEYVIRVKQDHVECLGLCLAKMTSHSEDSRLKFRPCASKASFKTTLTLFIGKI